MAEAEERKNVYDPQTGKATSIPESTFARAQETTGARELTKKETEAAVKDRENTNNLNPAGAWLAGQHGWIRGVGEAAGVPVDEGIVDIASLFGDQAKESTKGYLNSLDEAHPVASKWFGGLGTIAGGLTAAELGGAPGRIGAGIVPRTVGGVAARMAVGGVENVVQATTHDINEGALGKADANGDKLLAAMPKHFAVGAALTGLFEGGAAAGEAGVGAARKYLTPALERGASKAVGKEVGEAGEAAVAAGDRIRGLSGGQVPRSRSALLDTLEEEQGRLRGIEQGTYENALDKLRGEHQTAAGGMSARHEAERVAGAARGARGVESVEREAAEGTLDAAARGGARVEEAELGGAARRRVAHGEAFEANAAAADAEGRAGGAALHDTMAEAAAPLRHIDEQYAATRQALAGERAEAQTLAGRLEKEREANAVELGEGLLKIREGGHVPAGTLTPKQFDEILDEYVGMMGRKGDPSTRWAAETHLREVYKDDLSAAAGSSEAASNHIERLKSMAGDLEKAHSEAIEHLKRIDGTAEKVEAQYQKDMATAGKLADQKIAAAQKGASKEAQDAGKAADAAMARAKEVEASAAAEVEVARARGAREAAAASAAGEKRVAMAKAEAAAAAKKSEAVQTRERKGLAGEQAKAEKDVPKPTGKTDLDTQVETVKGRQAERPPLVSGGAGFGAILSLAHGHPLTAATAMLGSFAAGRARAEGNLVAARMMRGISERLASVDEAVRAGAASVLGRVGSRAAMAVTRDEPKEKLPKFEDISQALLSAKANPAIISAHVQKALGASAATAPDTYTSTLAAAHRAQQWLEAILPRPQVDSHSLTPHLEHGQISDTEKDEFMRSFAVINDPLHLFRDTKNGTVSEGQVDAVKFVYGSLYPQMKREMLQQIASLKQPLDYERELAIGVMLGTPTNEVEDRDFQGTLAAAFQDKSAAQAPQGSKSRSGASKLTKDVQSASQKIERGEP